MNRNPAAPPTQRTQLHVVLGAAFVALLAIAAWAAMSRVTFVVPAPLATLESLSRDMRRGDYITHLEHTLTAALCAFAAGVAIGGAAGLILGLSRRARITFEPLVIAFNGVPKIVLYPILLPIFGLGLGSKISMGALFAIFPVLVNVATGIRSLPPVYRRLAGSLNASPLQTVWYIVLPGIRRPLLVGLRLAASLALVGVVLSEFFATRYGLGRVVLQAYSTGAYPDMVGTILLLIVISFTVTLLLWRLERRVR